MIHDTPLITKTPRPSTGRAPSFWPHGAAQRYTASTEPPVFFQLARPRLSFQLAKPKFQAGEPLMPKPLVSCPTLSATVATSSTA